jgi:hypothetical protein
MLEYALRDTKIASKLEGDDLFMDQLSSSIEQLKSELNTSRGQRLEEVLVELFEAHILAVYYWEGIASGRISSLSSDAITPKLSAARKAAVKYARDLKRATKNKNLQGQALYHMAVESYLLGSGRGALVSTLEKNLDRLDSHLKRRAQFLIAFHKVHYQNDTKYRSTLESSIKSLTVEAGVAGRLSIARSYAGINHRGKKVGKTDKRYKSYLKKVSSQAARLAKNEQEKVLSQIVGIWRAAEGREGSWNDAPFSLTAYRDHAVVAGIIERSALENLTKDKNGAIKKYVALRGRFENQPLMVAIDRRILDLEYIKYKTGGSARSYEKALISKVAQYNDYQMTGSVDSKLSAPAHKEFKSRYKAFVFEAVKRALASSAKKMERNEAIQVALRYKETLDTESEKMFVDEQIAKIYVKQNRHSEAVAIYKDLIYRSKSPESERYLGLAIDSQRVLAKWPAQPPWTHKVGGGHEAERAELVQFYESLYKARATWENAAHLGLLKAHIGFKQDAFALWKDKLASDARSPDARQALGYMLDSYMTDKDYDSVEALALMAVKGNISPMRGNKRLNAVVYYGDALYLGGKHAYAQGDFNKAVEKFEKFRSQFANDKRAEEVTFLLANSYHNVGKHRESIVAMTDFVKIYPQSKYMRDALYLGSQWSIPMAYEEQTLYFSKKFLIQFPNDPEVRSVRESLIPLLVGRELYGDASALYYGVTENRKASIEERAEAAVSYMQIEQRYGDVSRANDAAKKVIAWAPNDQDRVSMALLFQARNVYESDVAKLRQIEAKLASFDQGNPLVAESLGEVRLMLAKKSQFIIKEGVFNLAVLDPKAEIRKFYGAFKTSVKAFMAVCAVPQASACVPALDQVAVMTEDAVRVFEDLTIPDSLDAKSVVEFNNFKQEILGELASVVQESDELARRYLAENHTTPDAVEEFSWGHSDDWYFDKSQNETGNSFVQWSVDESH